LVLLFTISLKKDLKIFIKINSFGVIFTLLIIFFILGAGISSLINTDFKIIESTDNYESYGPNFFQENYTL